MSSELLGVRREPEGRCDTQTEAGELHEGGVDRSNDPEELSKMETHKDGL